METTEKSRQIRRENPHIFSGEPARCAFPLLPQRFERFRVFDSGLSGPNRAMQPRCAMRFESHIPKSLAMPKNLFASDAKTHSLDLKSQENARKKKPAKILRCWPAMRKIGVFFKIERCEMPAIRTPAAVWPAMRAPAMPNR